MSRSKRVMIVEGGVYLSRESSGVWSALKVLAYEPGIVVARLYRNRWTTKPETVDLDTLMVDMDAADLERIIAGEDIPLGVAAVPISEEGFIADEHQMITVAPVTEEEVKSVQEMIDAQNENG